MNWFYYDVYFLSLHAAAQRTYKYRVSVSYSIPVIHPHPLSALLKNVFVFKINLNFKSDDSRY